MIRTMIIDAATSCGIMCSSYMSDSQSTLDPVAQVVSRAAASARRLPARRRRRDPLYVPSYANRTQKSGPGARALNNPQANTALSFWIATRSVKDAIHLSR